MAAAIGLLMPLGVMWQRRGKTRAAPVLAAAVAASCAEADVYPIVERHREHGIEVVVSHAPRSGAWHVAEIPTLRIGEDGGISEDYLFSGISGATRARSGGVVVADRHTAEVLLFDSKGRLSGVAGGRGRGPGEFPWIFNLLRCGEHSFHVVGPDGSISVFDMEGRFQRRFFPADIVGSVVRPSFVCGRDGSLVLTEQSVEPVGEKGLYRSSAEVILVSTGTTAKVVRLGSFPIQERLAGYGGSSSHPLGKRTSVATTGNRVYIGTADTWEILVFDAEGRQVQLIRRKFQPERLDRGTAKRHLDSWIETVPARDRELTLQRLSDAEYPASLPAYSRLLTDGRGYLWVEAFPQEWGGPTEWSVIDTNGAWVTDVRLPSNFYPFEIGDDFVLGRFTGEFGEESIRLYELRR